MSKLHMTTNGSFLPVILFTAGGMTLSAILLTMIFYIIHQNPLFLIFGGLLLCLSLFWLLLLISLFGIRLSDFTREICTDLNRMAAGSFCANVFYDRETQLDRIRHQLLKLYEIMRDTRRKSNEDRENLMILISDISHQIKTPVSNLKMVTETLLTKELPEKDRMDFLDGIRTEIEKLDFLFQSMIKTSRLETGTIRLVKADCLLYDTVAQAMSGILYSAENKNIHASVSCPEDIRLRHDPKWTAEALFNLLDNAVKYTPQGGSIRVLVEAGEMYAKISISDTGKGICEAHHAAIFKRFYREEDVHGVPGAGIGLYLTREIITLQGGYITVASAPKEGSTFSVFLPVR